MRPLYPFLPFALAFVFVAGAARAESLSVGLDHSARLHVNNASSVVVGDATVADVTVVDAHTVFVQGRNYGSTAIVVNDRDGRTVFSGDVTVVRPDHGVSIYRGVVRSDFACGSECTAVQHTVTVPLNGALAATK